MLLNFKDFIFKPSLMENLMLLQYLNINSLFRQLNVKTFWVTNQIIEILNTFILAEENET